MLSIISPKPLTVIDLFAGAGGFGLGFQLAGYKTVTSLEVDQWAADTLRYNHAQMNVIQQDIRHFQDAQQIQGVCSITPDVIIGGPPCQGFSVSGPAQKDPHDPRNSLFMDFAHWINVLMPPVFVMENVKGLLTRRNAQGESIVQIILQTFMKMGYCVEIWVLNAAEYNIPQIRERVFIVGNRLGKTAIGEPPKTSRLPSLNETSQLRPPLLFQSEDLPLSPSVWDAISDLPPLNAGDGQELQRVINQPQNDYQRLLQGHNGYLYNHVSMQHSKRLVERFKQVASGASSAEVPEAYRAHRRNGNGLHSEKMYDQNNRRLLPNRPSHTITASFYANFIHPFQHRNLTAREGARLQSFPDEYRFMGKKTTASHKLLQREGRLEELHLSQYNQIGNAVPPHLARQIAIHLLKVLR
jgi:DNA (cytosine-5)-methyltransferase 1